MTGKTLKELNVQPGDVVSNPYYDKGPMAVLGFSPAFPDQYSFDEYVIPPNESDFKLISRASDTPKLWRDMTPEEKGALLLAKHEGKVIECWGGNGWWSPCAIDGINQAYRIRPEPKVETVQFFANADGLSYTRATHRITFNRIDCEPDCDSVKMEKL